MISFILTAVFALPCLWLSLRRALHLYQLEGYFSQGYIRAVSSKKTRLFGAKTAFPLLVFYALACFYPYLCVLGSGLFVLVNLPMPAKKPLVFTPRVKRLVFTSLLLSVCLCATTFRINIYVFALTVALTVYFTPLLLVLWGCVNLPLEDAISAGYIRDAKRILRESPSLKIIGITGSYGKTSTKYFLKSLLSVKYNVFMTPGNFNTTLGVTRAIREGLRPYHEIFICEMGARHLGDVREICELVKPHCGIITSVGPQHLETFGSLSNVLRGKSELFKAASDKAFLNIDSAPIRDALDTFSGKTVITCGKGGEYFTENVKITADGTVFTLCAPNGERQEFRTRLLGFANVQNLTLAIACAHSFGIELAKLVPACAALSSVPHRLELKNRGGMPIIDDAYNSNPEGAKVALDTLSLFEGTRIAVTPGLVELGSRQDSENEALGAYAAKRCDILVLVGETNRDAILKGLASAKFPEDKIICVKSVNDAFSYIYSVRDEKKLALLLNDLPDNYS